MKIKQGFVIRNVGGEFVVVPVGEMSKRFHGMIQLNQTGAFLWEFFSKDHTLEEGIHALLAEYEVDQATATRDAQAFIQTLKENAFLE